MAMKVTDDQQDIINSNLLNQTAIFKGTDILKRCSLSFLRKCEYNLLVWKRCAN